MEVQDILNLIEAALQPRSWLTDHQKDAFLDLHREIFTRIDNEKIANYRAEMSNAESPY